MISLRILRDRDRAGALEFVWCTLTVLITTSWPLILQQNTPFISTDGKHENKEICMHKKCMKHFRAIFRLFLGKLAFCELL